MSRTYAWFAAHLGGKWLPWGVGTFFVLLYGVTTAPSLVALFDDSLELQLVLPTFGIVHPTGYPFYTVLGGLWSSLLPVGNWAWRANLFSALAAGITVGLVFAAARRLTASVRRQGSAWAGVAAALVFGLGPVWWQQATVAEVYALHNLLAAAILVTTIGIEQAPQPAFDRRMALLCLLFGLGLAHHRTVVLLAPGLAVYLLWRVPGIWRPRRAWFLWGALLLAPLLFYLYLPLRASAGVRDLHGSYVNTWDGFWDHVLARGYTAFFSASPLAVDRTPAAWLSLWLTQLGVIGAALSLLGLGWLGRRHGPQFAGWVLVALGAGANLLFALLYRVGDQEVFLLPALLCTAIFAGGGLAIVLQRTPRRWQWLGGLLAIVVLVVNPGRGAWSNRSQEWATHDYAVDMAKAPFPPHSQVIGLEGEMTALRYMQLAEGLGKAATPVVADDPALRRAAIASGLAAGAPVFLTREVAGIADQYSFSGLGPLVRVWPRGEAAPSQPQIQRRESLAGEQLQLHGYDLERLDWAGGPVARVAFYWEPTVPLTRTLKVSLRAVAPDGAVLPMADGTPAVRDQHPLRGVAPTSTWLPGEVVRDVHELYLPVRSGLFDLLAIVYDADTLEEMGRIPIVIGAQ